jgi:DNA-binding transcriptional LysR family regulator
MDRLFTLQVLVAVMESQSFSAAAKRLGLGQPAVSKSIAQLEKRLNTRLFVRTTRGLNPTEPARLYYEHARRALEHIEEAERAAKGEGAALSGTLRVSAPVTFTRMQIIPHLGPFLAAHPALSLDILLDDRHVDLLREGVDMAIRVGPLDDSSMTARRLASSRRVVLGSRRFLDRYGIPDAPAELERYPFVIYTQSKSPRTLKLQRGSESIQIPINGPLTVSAAEGLREAVLAGLGLATISTWVFGEELARGDVVEVLSDWNQPVIDVSAVYPSGRMPSIKARVFTDFVERVLNADIPLQFEGDAFIE